MRRLITGIVLALALFAGSGVIHQHSTVHADGGIAIVAPK